MSELESSRRIRSGIPYPPPEQGGEGSKAPPNLPPQGGEGSKRMGVVRLVSAEAGHEALSVRRVHTLEDVGVQLLGRHDQSVLAIVAIVALADSRVLKGVLAIERLRNAV